jgi:hypothetical protein
MAGAEVAAGVGTGAPAGRSVQMTRFRAGDLGASVSPPLPLPVVLFNRLRDLVVQRFVDDIATSICSMEAKAIVSGSVVAQIERADLFNAQRFPRCLLCCDVPF